MRCRFDSVGSIRNLVLKSTSSSSLEIRTFLERNVVRHMTGKEPSSF